MSSGSFTLTYEEAISNGGAPLRRALDRFGFARVEGVVPGAEALVPACKKFVSSLAVSGTFDDPRSVYDESLWPKFEGPYGALPRARDGTFTPGFAANLGRASSARSEHISCRRGRRGALRRGVDDSADGSRSARVPSILRAQPRVRPAKRRCWKHALSAGHLRIKHLSTPPLFLRPLVPLATSLDGIAINKPRDYSISDARSVKWHTDQSPHRNAFEMLQSVISLTATGPNTAGTSFLSKSHRLHHTLSWHKDSDWCVLKAGEVAQFISAGCERVDCCTMAGDMVLWDSRTVHTGRLARAALPHISWRFGVYVCAVPASQLSEADRRRKMQAMTGLHTTNHPPDGRSVKKRGPSGRGVLRRPAVACDPATGEWSQLALQTAGAIPYPPRASRAATGEAASGGSKRPRGPESAELRQTRMAYFGGAAAVDLAGPETEPRRRPPRARASAGDSAAAAIVLDDEEDVIVVR